MARWNCPVEISPTGKVLRLQLWLYALLRTNPTLPPKQASGLKLLAPISRVFYDARKWSTPKLGSRALVSARDLGTKLCHFLRPAISGQRPWSEAAATAEAKWASWGDGKVRIKGGPTLPSYRRVAGAAKPAWVVREGTCQLPVPALGTAEMQAALCRCTQLRRCHPPAPSEQMGRCEGRRCLPAIWGRGGRGSGG